MRKNTGAPQSKLNAALVKRIRDVNAMLIRELEGIAFFAPGNGDVCEIIARRAREALASIPEQRTKL